MSYKNSIFVDNQNNDLDIQLPRSQCHMKSNYLKKIIQKVITGTLLGLERKEIASQKFSIINIEHFVNLSETDVSATDS